ncbi:head GIN domain-containing protein [Ulvibacter antarcticus]|uniref:Putative autotransporter adhesin-like protein n=1 Tax=Ulvibacter antarcticus TaxID=442714 RepID=A0A3L9ZC28_9FLAO|nr:head GIN domain-containing protein [Ulvibacter antarcticus]RMA64172.1 putative autotransporter adhesin-like protein [Ulvibacter antarcticus]
MKTIAKITMAVALTLISFSEATAQKGKFITGSGNVTTETTSTSDYDKINVVGSMDVHLESGSEGSISVTTDDNLHEIVEISSDGNTLIIKIINNVSFNSKKGIHVTVPFKEISAVSLVGSGDVSSKDTIKSNMFESSLTGSGDIVLSIDSSNVNAKVTGSGDMTLSGTADILEVKVTGSGDFEGKSLKSSNTQAYVSGSGDISVDASSSLKARVNGSGTIKYSGNPTTNDKKVRGSGDIKAI